jgi:hypothetical protein
MSSPPQAFYKALAGDRSEPAKVGFTANRFIVFAGGVAAVFDPETESWSMATNIPPPPGETSFAAGDSVCYVVRANSASCFDAKTKAWSSAWPVPAALGLTASTAPEPIALLQQVGDRVYAVGQHLFAFDLEKRSWSACAPPPNPKTSAVAAVDSSLAALEWNAQAGWVVALYDPRKDAWSTVSNFDKYGNGHWGPDPPDWQHPPMLIGVDRDLYMIRREPAGAYRPLATRNIWRLTDDGWLSVVSRDSLFAPEFGQDSVEAWGVVGHALYHYQDAIVHGSEPQ